MTQPIQFRLMRASLGTETVTVLLEGEPKIFNQTEEMALFCDNLSFRFEAVTASEIEMAAADIRVVLRAMPSGPRVPVARGLPLPIWKNDRAIVLSRAGREIRFHDGSLVLITRPLQAVTISSHYLWSDLADVLESWVGISFEKKMNMRFHAVARGSEMLIARSGFGKSTLAAKWLSTDPSMIQADEVCYVSDEKVVNDRLTIRIKDETGAWRTRYGRRKILVRDHRALPWGDAKIQKIYFGITPASGIDSLVRDVKLIWWIESFLGYGLPQHVEYSLFLITLPDWLRVAFVRFKTLRRLRSKFVGGRGRGNF